MGIYFLVNSEGNKDNDDDSENDNIAIIMRKANLKVETEAMRMEIEAMRKEIWILREISFTRKLLMA